MKPYHNAAAMGGGAASFLGGIAYVDMGGPTLTVIGGILMLLGACVLAVAMSYW